MILNQHGENMNELLEFNKSKDYLICVDSDGCAIDTMNIKHKQCFGPMVVKFWSLEPWSQDVLNLWNDINLFSKTRGINRFKGLALILQVIDQTYKQIEGLDDYITWVNASPKLSEQALKRTLDQVGTSCLKQALAWSKEVSLAIASLDIRLKAAYSGVPKCLSLIREKADIVVISSSNKNAVTEEWTSNNIIDYTNAILTQEVGNKTVCINSLLKYGYEKKNVIMIGDAHGDLQAAEESGVYFYPIIVNEERECWNEFREKGLNLLLNGTFSTYCDEKKLEFFKKL